MPDKKRILVFDAQDTGHHLQYLNYLNSCADSLSSEIVLLIRKSAVDRINPPIYVDKILSIDLPEIPVGGLRKSMQECRYVAHLAKREKVAEVVFININPYVLALCSPGLRWKGVKISGINYSPPHRITVDQGAAWRVKIATILKQWRKYAQFYLLAKLPEVSKVYILDDKDGAQKLNRQLNSSKFSYLPDPIDEYRQLPDKLRMRDLFSLPTGQLIALQFGAIGPRKNTLVCVQAFLDERNLGVHLLVVGKGSPEYVQMLEEMVAKEKRGRDRVTICNRFVSEKNLNLLFSSCDFLVMAYKDFYGSSGVLGHAAKYGKPVIAGNKGLIAYLVSKYQLGVLVEPVPAGIMEGVKELKNGRPLDYGAKEFLDDKKVEAFATILTG